MSAKIFEDKPRWPGGPKHCIAANLPAFKTAAEVNAFDNSCGGHGVKKQWDCESYGLTHVQLSTGRKK